MTGQGKARPRASDETWWGRTYKLPKAYKGMQDRNTQTHRQVSAALLTDSPQACSPFGGLSRPRCPSLPLARSLLLPTVDLLRSAFGPEKVSVHTLDPKLGPRPNSPLSTLPSCHLQLPRLATERLPGHGRGAGYPSEPRHSPRSLGGNHKNKAGASFVPRGMFSPCFCFMKLFGL